MVLRVSILVQKLVASKGDWELLKILQMLLSLVVRQVLLVLNKLFIHQKRFEMKVQIFFSRR